MAEIKCLCVTMLKNDIPAIMAGDQQGFLTIMIFGDNKIIGSTCQAAHYDSKILPSSCGVLCVY